MTTTLPPQAAAGPSHASPKQHAVVFGGAPVATYSVADLPANMRSKIAVDGTHWIWTGAKSARGYGCVGVFGKSQLTHRVVYELLVGPIPEGLVIDHVVARGCGISLCCNPAHLEPVTNLENIRRGTLATKMQCPAGHDYSGDNLKIRVKRNGWVNRQCRECMRVRRAQAQMLRTKASKERPLLAADDPRHGTTNGYTYWGCRCGPCFDRNIERLRIWRESKES